MKSTSTRKNKWHRSSSWSNRRDNSTICCKIIQISGSSSASSPISGRDCSVKMPFRKYSHKQFILHSPKRINTRPLSTLKVIPKNTSQQKLSRPKELQNNISRIIFKIWKNNKRMRWDISISSTNHCWIMLKTSHFTMTNFSIAKES